MSLRGFWSSVLLIAGLTAQPPQVRTERVATFSLPGGAAMAAAFSPDGALLATGGELGDLVVAEAATGRVRWRARPSDHWIGTLAFAPDGTRLACLGRHLTMHDAATGAEQWRHPNTGPRTFVWRADGGQYAYPADKAVRVRDASDGELAARHGFEHGIRTLCYGGDDLYAGDSVGRVWRMAGGARAPELLHDRREEGRRENGHDDVSFGQLAWVDGMLIEQTYRDGLRRGDARLPLPGAVYDLTVSRDGRSFAVGGKEAVVRWWTDVAAPPRDLPVPGPVAALAFAPDGATLFASTYGGDALRLGGDAPSPVPLEHPDRIRASALSPDGSVVAMLGDRCVLRTVDGTATHTFANVKSIAAGRSGSEILLTTDGLCRVVDGRTGAEVVRVAADTYHLAGTVLGPGQRVFCGLNATFTDLATGERGALQLPEHVHIWDNARYTARAPDGSWAVASIGGIEGDLGSLVVTDADGTVRLAERRGLWSSVAFSPDGRWLVVVRSNPTFLGDGGVEPRLVVYDARTLEVLREIPKQVDSMHFLDPHRALVGDREGLAVLDVETGEFVQRLTEPNTRWFRLADDARTLTCNDGREVVVYRLHVE